MRYRGGDYGRRNYGDYGRRGRRYRGEDMIDSMHEMYQNYSEANEEYNRGNYGAKEDTLESYKYMLKSFKDFYKHLKQEAESQEEAEMLRQTAQEIAEMM